MYFWCLDLSLRSAKGVNNCQVSPSANMRTAKGLLLTESIDSINSQLQITKSIRYMLPKSRGVFFQREKNACGKHIDHGVLGGTLKSTNIDKIHKIHAPKIQGVFFFLRSPKRRRQLGHRRTRLGDPKPVKNVPKTFQSIPIAFPRHSHSIPIRKECLR